MFLRENAWWDGLTWNTLFGCLPAYGSIICPDCWAARWVATLHASHDVEFYRGTTIKTKAGRDVFAGPSRVLPDGHPAWKLPLRDDWYGHGAPALIAVCLTGDCFFEGHPIEAIERTVGTIVLSPHIGLFLTRRQRRMRDYILAQSPLTIARWILKTWWGISACTQAEFDLRWPDLREVARLGFTVFVSLAPLLEPITLPPDFLALGNRAWLIVNGMEKCSHERSRDTHPDWMRRLRDQCAAAGVPFFVKGMSFNDPIPIDLLRREFPTVIDQTTTNNTQKDLGCPVPNNRYGSG
jgi:protein gp37